MSERKLLIGDSVIYGLYRVGEVIENEDSEGYVKLKFGGLMRQESVPSSRCFLLPDDNNPSDNYKELKALVGQKIVATTLNPFSGNPAYTDVDLVFVWYKYSRVLHAGHDSIYPNSWLSKMEYE